MPQVGDVLRLRIGDRGTSGRLRAAFADRHTRGACAGCRREIVICARKFWIGGAAAMVQGRALAEVTVSKQPVQTASSKKESGRQESAADSPVLEKVVRAAGVLMLRRAAGELSPLMAAGELSPPRAAGALMPLRAACMLMLLRAACVSSPTASWVLMPPRAV